MLQLSLLAEFAISLATVTVWGRELKVELICFGESRRQRLGKLSSGASLWKRVPVATPFTKACASRVTKLILWRMLWLTFTLLTFTWLGSPSFVA